MSNETATLTVGIDPTKAVRGARKFTSATKQARDSAGRLSKSVNTVDKRLNKLGGTASNVGRILAGSFAGISGAVILKKVISTFTEFEDVMNTAGLVAGATTKQFAMMSEEARILGATTRFSATEAADGLLFLSRAGFTTEESIATIGDTLDLAAAGAIGLGEAADFASNILKGFSLSASEMERVVDTLIDTSNASNTNITQLAQAMKFVAPVSFALGRSIEETAAAIGVLGDAGIQGSMAGTAMRASLLKLLSPTEGAKKAIKGLGLELDDLNPISHDIATIFETLSETVGTKGRDAFAKAASEIFGVRQVSSALVLATTESVAKMRELTSAMEDTTGTAKKMATAMSDDLEGAFKNLKSAVSEIFLVIGDAGLLGAMRDIVDFSTDVARALAGMDEQFIRAGASAMLVARALETVAVIGATLIGLKLTAWAFALGKSLLTLKSIAGGLWLLVNPFTAIPIAVVAAGAAIFIFRDKMIEFGGETVRIGDLVTATWRTIIQQIKEAPEAMRDLIGATVRDMGKWVEVHFSFLTTLWEGTVAFIEFKLKDLINIIDNVNFAMGNLTVAGDLAFNELPDIKQKVIIELIGEERLKKFRLDESQQNIITKGISLLPGIGGTAVLPLDLKSLQAQISEDKQLLVLERIQLRKSGDDEGVDALNEEIDNLRDASFILVNQLHDENKAEKAVEELPGVFDKILKDFAANLADILTKGKEDEATKTAKAEAKSQAEFIQELEATPITALTRFAGGAVGLKPDQDILKDVFDPKSVTGRITSFFNLDKVSLNDILEGTKKLDAELKRRAKLQELLLEQEQKLLFLIEDEELVSGAIVENLERQLSLVGEDDVDKEVRKEREKLSKKFTNLPSELLEIRQDQVEELVRAIREAEAAWEDEEQAIQDHNDAIQEGVDGLKDLQRSLSDALQVALGRTTQEVLDDERLAVLKVVGAYELLAETTREVTEDQQRQIEDVTESLRQQREELEKANIKKRARTDLEEFDISAESGGVFEDLEKDLDRFGKSDLQLRIEADFEGLREAEEALDGIDERLGEVTDKSKEFREELERQKDQVIQLEIAVEAMRGVEEIVSIASKEFSNAISDILLGVQSVGDAFRNMALNIFENIVRRMVERVTDALADLILDLTTNLIKAGIGGLFGASTAFAEGGIIEKPTRALMGEAGPEAVMPLRRGSDGKLGVSVQGLLSENLAAQAIREIIGPIDQDIFALAMDLKFEFQALRGDLAKILSPRRFAEGGIVNRATFGIVGEAGPEAIIPLRQLPQINIDNGGIGNEQGDSARNVTVVLNVKTNDASSFRRSGGQIARDLRRMTSGIS